MGYDGNNSIYRQGSSLFGLRQNLGYKPMLVGTEGLSINYIGTWRPKGYSF